MFSLAIGKKDAIMRVANTVCPKTSEKEGAFMVRTRKADFTEGKLFFPILFYTLPIIATGLLQLLYNMADQVVVGQFSGDANALGAVGSSAAVNSFFVNLFVGVTAGTSVVISQLLGSKSMKEVERAVHTSLSFGAIIGVAVGVLAFTFARPILVLLGTKEELLSLATLYVRIIALGIPFSSIYNFGAAVLRSAGDSKTPLGILSATGILNVLLNLLFVIVFDMSVAGVALATVCAHVASAAWVLLVLSRRDEVYRLRFRKLRIHKEALRRILRIGVPSAIQGCLFSISNMIIQSAINTFPTETVSGYTVSGTLEGFTYIAMNSFYQGAVTFAGQNYGAKKRGRLSRVLWYTLVQVVLVGILAGGLELIFAAPISSLFVDTSLPEAPAIIAASVEKLQIILSTYFFCGVMEVMSGYLRGMGYSVVPMLSCVLGVCGVRALWVFFVFPRLPHTAFSLFVVYVLSWLFVIVLHSFTIFYASRKMKKSGWVE